MNVSMEVFSKDDAAKAASLDSKISKDGSKYTSDNTFAYYIACNTWYHMISVVDKWCAVSVLDYIKRNGLLTIIKQLDSDSTSLVQGKKCSSQIGQLIDSSVNASHINYYGLSAERNIFRDDLATKLQLMRYLKRFSPQHADSIASDGITGFLQNENATKMKQRKEHPLWLIKAVREEIKSVVNWDSVINDIDNISPYDFKIPSGSTYEGHLSIGKKIDRLASTHPEWFMMPFGLPYVFPYYNKDQDEDKCLVLPVPKSYKAVRMIAMEPLSRQAKGGVVADILAQHLPSFLDIRDQSRNQELARLGSNGSLSLATLDATNASDLISKTLFREIFPPEFIARVDRLLSHFTVVRNVTRSMQMMSTAGHSLTFVLETLVYYGIAAAAARYVSLFGGEGGGYISVYGDDVILPSKVAETAQQFYSMLGLQINMDKSYWEGPYRESCGEEYYNGINVSSVYFPRFPLVGKISRSKFDFGVRMYRDSYRGKIDDSTTMLVDLQKRLFCISQDAALFLWEVIKAGRPKLTASKYGSECNDCWAATSIGIEVNTAERVTARTGIKLPPSVVGCCATEKHSYASLQYRLSGPLPVDYYRSRAFDIYKYQTFLKTGPTYASALDELLGVSEPPLSIEAAYGDGRLIWRYSIE